MTFIYIILLIIVIWAIAVTRAGIKTRDMVEQLEETINHRIFEKGPRLGIGSFLGFFDKPESLESRIRALASQLKALRKATGYEFEMKKGTMPELVAVKKPK